MPRIERFGAFCVFALELGAARGGGIYMRVGYHTRSVSWLLKCVGELLSRRFISECVCESTVSAA
jgi:hypothetical protein